MSVRAAVRVHDALDGAITAIDAGGSPIPRLDAELLLSDALGTTRERLYSDPAAAVGGPAVRAFQSHVRWTASRWPTSSATAPFAASIWRSTPAC